MSKDDLFDPAELVFEEPLFAPPARAASGTTPPPSQDWVAIAPFTFTARPAPLPEPQTIRFSRISPISRIPHKLLWRIGAGAAALLLLTFTIVALRS
jgi:hypothetical protein